MKADARGESKGFRDRQRLGEQRRRPSAPGGAGVPARALTQRPQGPPMAVLGALFFEPGPVVAHEVAKPAGIRIPRMLDKGGKAGRQDFGQRLLARLIECAGQQQRARIVVDAIAMQRDPAPNARRAAAGRCHRTSTENGPFACRAPPGFAVRPQPWRSARNHLQPVTLPRMRECRHVALGGALPCHRTAGRIGPLAHGLPARLVGQQLRDIAAGLRSVAKRQRARRARRPAIPRACQYGVETTGLPRPKL